VVNVVIPAIEQVMGRIVDEIGNKTGNIIGLSGAVYNLNAALRSIDAHLHPMPTIEASFIPLGSGVDLRTTLELNALTGRIVMLTGKRTCFSVYISTKRSIATKPIIGVVAGNIVEMCNWLGKRAGAVRGRLDPQKTGNTVFEAPNSAIFNVFMINSRLTGEPVMRPRLVAKTVEGAYTAT